MNAGPFAAIRPRRLEFPAFRILFFPRLPM